jgi:hypothetical protein
MPEASKELCPFWMEGAATYAGRGGDVTLWGGWTGPQVDECVDAR